jgi:hypothetical protein
VDDDLIDRGEIVGLILSVHDIAASLKKIEKLLEDDDGEEEVDS